MGRKQQTLQSLLQRTEEVDGCRLWLGCKDKDGYGITSVKGKKCPAHRAAFILAKSLEQCQLNVLHLCHHRACINPAHLYLGTQHQNVQDQKTEGTFVYGSKNGMALLHEDDVKHIKTSFFSIRALAKYYGVSYHTIWDIRRGRSWRQVK